MYKEIMYMYIVLHVYIRVVMVTLVLYEQVSCWVTMVVAKMRNIRAG